MFRGFLAVCNLLIVGALLLSAYSAYINPNSIWQFSFAGLLFPPLALLNMLFVCWWIFRKPWFSLLSITALLLCHQQLKVTFAANFPNKEEAEHTIKVMSWNVKNFDLYNWTGNVKTRKEMLDLIRQEAPQVLCLQEFYSDQGVIMNNVRYLRDTLGYTYFHFEPTIELDRIHCNKPIHQQWGEATFSKFPIVKANRVDFKNSRSNDCIYTDLKIGSDTLRVYNMHLQSIHLDEKDYNAIQKMEASQVPDWIPLKRIARKMKFSYCTRASQAEQVAKVIRKYKGKQVVCGDLNDVPVSYTYNTIVGSKNLQDAFVAKGWGIGRTFVSLYSYFRIDYILASSNLQIQQYHSSARQLSDHFPAIASFSLE
ncbi:MAG: endonuclease/exonuclease/phosphatase family protein [Chitinophagales bacterium]|nr:endonuclease/exonuclease/phosphatase family protein [Chitinophagales bacterium]